MLGKFVLALLPVTAALVPALPAAAGTAAENARARDAQPNHVPAVRFSAGVAHQPVPRLRSRGVLTAAPSSIRTRAGLVLVAPGPVARPPVPQPPKAAGRPTPPASLSDVGATAATASTDAPADAPVLTDTETRPVVPEPPTETPARPAVPDPPTDTTARPSVPTTPVAPLRPAVPEPPTDTAARGPVPTPPTVPPRPAVPEPPAATTRPAPPSTTSGGQDRPPTPSREALLATPRLVSAVG